MYTPTQHTHTTVTCTAASITNGTVVGGVTTIDYGQSLTYTCDPGHPAADVPATCLANGDLSALPQTCTLGRYVTYT